MPSARYTLHIKPEDLQPDEPIKPMTWKQKRENFWFYYKWHILGGILGIILLGIFVHDMMSREIPDVEIAIVTKEVFPDSFIQSLTQQLQENPEIEDSNQDGKVLVQINQYNIATDQQAPTDYSAQVAGSVKLSADIQAGLSTVFITDNLEGLERITGIFSEQEGATFVKWQDAQGLRELDLVVQDPLLDKPIDFAPTMEHFVVARRGYWEDEKESVMENAYVGDKLYEILTGVPSRWK